MITYNPAFDIYHCIFRIAHILTELSEGESIEVDKICIWDFYILYPGKLYNVTIKAKESKYRELRKQYIKKEKNPYEYTGDNTKLFQRMRPYQIAAISSLISYGILDKEYFYDKKIRIKNYVLLSDLLKKLGKFSIIEKNTLSFLSIFSKAMSMLGESGLKARTKLIESKYDAE